MSGWGKGVFGVDDGRFVKGFVDLTGELRLGG